MTIVVFYLQYHLRDIAAATHHRDSDVVVCTAFVPDFRHVRTTWLLEILFILENRIELVSAESELFVMVLTRTWQVE